MSGPEHDPAEERTQIDECIAEIHRLKKDNGALLMSATALMNENKRLHELIGKPSEGSHPDEVNPRGATWHAERRNWVYEVDTLRAHIKGLAAENASLKARLENEDDSPNRLPRQT